MMPWDELLQQAELALNLLRDSRTHPKTLAYAHLHEIFDFSSTPLALPGFKSILFKHPTQQRKYAKHSLLGYYLGPVMDHYCCFYFHIPIMGGIRTCGTVQFFST